MGHWGGLFLPLPRASWLHAGIPPHPAPLGRELTREVGVHPVTSGYRLLLFQALMGGGIWSREFGLVFSVNWGWAQVSVLLAFNIPCP